MNFRRLNALQLGYRARWLWLFLAVVGVAYWAAWLLEPYKYANRDWWLPNQALYLVLEHLGTVYCHAGRSEFLGMLTDNGARGGLEGVLGYGSGSFLKMFLGAAPGYGWAMLADAAMLLLAVLLFLPLGRTADLPARRRPTLRTAIGAALPAALLSVGATALVLTLMGW